MLSRIMSCLVVAVAGGAGVAEAAVTAQLIQSFGGRGLNANGTVAAGFAAMPNGFDYHALRWTQSGGVQDIGATLPEGADSFGIAVSDDGSLMVGYSEPPIMQAFWWTASAGHVRIGNFAEFPGAVSMANGVSGDGKVVVGAGVTDNFMAFRWTKAGGMVPLGRLPGAALSEARATNIDGSIIVGSSGNAAFRWTSAEGMQPLPPLQNASCINSEGTAVAGTIDNNVACVVRGGYVRMIGTLPGAAYFVPNGISGDGSLIVGEWTKPSEVVFNDRFRSYLWTARGGLVDLPVYLASQGFDTTRWSFSSVQCVSRDGRVLMGSGRQNAVGGTWRATIPAPCTSDLNNDGVVDDADFALFAPAYDVLDCADAAMAQWCPADLNLDSVVDDSDFVLFVGAYDALVCP